MTGLKKREKIKQLRQVLELILEAPVLNVEQYHLNIPPHMLQDLTYMDLVALQLVERGAMGDMKAVQEIFDRLLGKPVQTNENVNKNVTYYDFLIQVAEKEEKKKLGIDEAKVLDVKSEPVDEPDLLDDLL